MHQDRSVTAIVCQAGDGAWSAIRHNDPLLAVLAHLRRLCYTPNMKTVFLGPLPPETVSIDEAAILRAQVKELQAKVELLVDILYHGGLITAREADDIERKGKQ